MANALFDPGREGFLDGSIDWDTDDIRVMLVKSAYTFSAALNAARRCVTFPPELARHASAQCRA